MALGKGPDQSRYFRNMRSVADRPNSLSTAIGVDVGGTNTKLVLIDRSGVVLQRRSERTPRATAPDLFVVQLSKSVRSFQEEAGDPTRPTIGIGICTPQFSDGPDWIQRQANNMAVLEGFALRPALERELGPRLAISYDSGAAAIAEHLFGIGRGVSRLLTLSIGTGASIGVVTDGRAVDFNWGGTGDSGQIIVDPEASERCACGGLGCLESVATAPAIRRAAIKAIRDGKETLLADQFAVEGDISAEDVVHAGAEGDRVAVDILARVGRFVGIALASYIHLFRPELIVLCGGVSQAGELLLKPVRSAVDRFTNPWYLARLRGIEVSAFPLDGAAIGVAALAFDANSFGDRPANISTEDRQ
jgi:glucokinase